MNKWIYFPKKHRYSAINNFIFKIILIKIFFLSYTYLYSNSINKYNSIIKKYKIQIEKNKKNYKTMEKLADIYYKLKKYNLALKYFKLSEKKTKNKAYNYYHQAICYINLKKENISIDYLKSAYKINRSIYAQKSLYQLGYILYLNKKNKNSKKYFNIYLKKYPNGRYKNKIINILNSIDSKKNEFKTNPLSIISIPHFWYLKAGWLGDMIGFKSPDTDGLGNPAISDSIKLKQAPIFELGIGLGAFKFLNINSIFSYSYAQKWFLDMGYLAEGASPIRPSIMQREHKFISNIYYNIFKSINLGIFAKQEYWFTGSKFFDTQYKTSSNLSTVIETANVNHIIPWISFKFNKYNQTLIYNYFRKNKDNQDYNGSNQSYLISLKRVHLSLGFTHILAIPDIDTAFTLGAYRYQFFYNNNIYFNHDEIGFGLGSTTKILNNFFLKLKINGYIDQYHQKFIVTNKSCGEDNSKLGINHCFRNDIGLIFQSSIVWNITKNQRISIKYQYIINQNPEFIEYESNRHTFIATYINGFPNISKILKMSDMYRNQIMNTKY